MSGHIGIPLGALYAYEIVCVVSSVLMVAASAARKDIPTLILLAGLASLHYRLPRLISGRPGVQHAGPSYWLDVCFACLAFAACLVRRPGRDTPLIVAAGFLMSVAILFKRAGRYGAACLLHGGGHALIGSILLSALLGLGR